MDEFSCYVVVKFSFMKCFADLCLLVWSCICPDSLPGLMTFFVQTVTAFAIEVPLLTIAERKGWFQSPTSCLQQLD